MSKVAIIEGSVINKFHPQVFIGFLIVESLLILLLLSFGWKFALLLVLLGLSSWLLLASDLGFIYLLLFIAPFESFAGISYETSRLLKWSLALFFGLVVLGKVAIFPKRFIFPLNAVTKFLMLFIGWGIFTSFFSVDHIASLIRILIEISVLILFLLIFNSVTEEKGTRKVINLWIWIAVLVSVVGIGQYLLMERTRIASFYANPNTLGIFYFLIIPVIVSLGLYEDRKGPKKRYYLLFGLLLLALFLTGARASWLASLVGIITVAILAKNRRLLSTILFGGLLTIIGVVLSPTLREFFEAATRWSRGVTFRNFIWLSGLKLIKAHPFFGVGLGATPKALGQYSAIRNPSIRILLDEILKSGYMHSLYLHVTSEVGIPGLLILLWFFKKLFMQLRTFFKKEGNRYCRALLAGGIALIPAALVHGFFELSIMGASSTSIYFWIFLAVTYRMVNLGPKERIDLKGHRR